MSLSFLFISVQLIFKLSGAEVKLKLGDLEVIEAVHYLRIFLIRVAR